MLLGDQDIREKYSSVPTSTRIEDTRNNQLDFSTVFFCCHYKLVFPIVKGRVLPPRMKEKEGKDNEGRTILVFSDNKVIHENG